MLNLDANGNRLAPEAVWNDGYGAGGGRAVELSIDYGIRECINTGEPRG
jgi:hypothetical protein